MTTTVNPIKATVLAACLSLVAPLVGAQTFEAVRLFDATPGNSGGSVGLAVIATRQYQGSDENRNLLVPKLDYQWGNGWFAGTSNGLGVNLSGRRDMAYGLRLTADMGRSQSRSSALTGMGDIDAKPEVGGFFNYLVNRETSLTTSLRYGSGSDSKGLLVDVGANYVRELAPQWRLGLRVAATYANGEYMQSYFGVDAAQSLASGYTAYKPGAGIRDVRAGVLVSYQLNPNMMIISALSLSSLQGDANSSPLTRKRTDATGIVAVSYGF